MIQKINNLEATIEALDDDELQALSNELRGKASKGSLEEILPKAFALVREAAWRVLSLRPYDCQLYAGLTLHSGCLAELATGEGKTLAALLPAYLNAISSEFSGVVIVTSNDYLAKRDRGKMGEVLEFLGVSVGVVTETTSEQQRVVEYSRDVVYTTNAQLGFDYLRDNLALAVEGVVLGEGLSGKFCIVDEVDSILIDESRTPLIISKQVPASASRYEAAVKIADALANGIHYDVDQKKKSVVLTEKGFNDAENALGVKSLFEIGDGGSWAGFISNALKAKELFRCNVDYAIVGEGEGREIGIVDTFTGRVLEGRRWSDGLHQSVEAKEGITVSSRSQVIATVTYQSLFRQFKKLGGMTGTAKNDEVEFDKTYDLRVVQVPTNNPVARRDYPDVIFKTRAAADRALVREVEKVLESGRPILIGTTSVNRSELLVAALAERGVTASLLNADRANVQREGEIIAQAGRSNVVTVATNMAGRGTDILLGGDASTMAKIFARSMLGGRNVGILNETEVELLPPGVDQGYYPCEVGEVPELIECESLLKKRFPNYSLTARELEMLITQACDATESEEDEPYVLKLREGIDRIKELFDSVLAPEKERVLKAGGLYIMGTTRHESSRIDQQLRGRAGRQGDPGSSRFFLSFEDEIFTIFGGDKMSGFLDLFRVSEDMPIEAPQVAEALDKVQGSVEENYAGIRASVWDFDKILNAQRVAVYEKRKRILIGSDEDSVKALREYSRTTIEDIVKGNGSKEVDKVVEKCIQFFPKLAEQGEKLIQATESCNGEGEIVGVIDNALGSIIDSLIAGVNAGSSGAENKFERTFRYITLLSMDNAWTDHLQGMDSLKETVTLKSFRGDMDPLTEYQMDAYGLYESLLDTMRRNSVYSFFQAMK